MADSSYPDGGEHPMRFTVEVRPDRDRIIVVPRGELDLATSATLREELDDLVVRGFARLVVDLRQLEFMDSTGLRLLLAQSQRDDATVSVIEGSDPVRKLLDLTGARRLLRFEQDGKPSG